MPYLGKENFRQSEGPQVKDLSSVHLGKSTEDANMAAVE